MAYREEILPKYGRLTTIREYREIRKSKVKRFIECVCDCGNTINVIFSALKSGNTKSCGCLKKDLMKDSKKTHGMSNSKEYISYRAMKSRCYSKTNQDYDLYGGRGIKVCDRWLGEEGFSNFLQDLGERPEKQSLDRIDSDGDYTPENCKWSTQKEQCRNVSDNRIINYNNKDYVMSVLCEELKLDYRMFSRRLYRGWEIEDAIKAPKGMRYKDFLKTKIT